MGVGNSTDEPVDYDHDDPGEPPSQNSTLLPSTTMGFGGGMLLAGLVCHCPPFPLIGGVVLVIGGIWTFLANRRQPRGTLEPVTGREKLSTGVAKVKKTLKPCQYHVDPTPFATGTTVTFYRQGTAEEIGRVEIGGPQAMVTMAAQNPVTQPLNTTVNSVILTKSGGSHQIDVLETS